MRRVDVKPLMFLSLVEHTIIEAAEQALPAAGPAQAAGYSLDASTCAVDRSPELVASWSRSPIAPTHLLSVPVACTDHQRLNS